MSTTLTQHAMTCPKCAGDMRTYERNGVIVDQCRDCRGLFLDRGELERLVDLEGGGTAPSSSAAPAVLPATRPEPVGPPASTEHTDPRRAPDPRYASDPRYPQDPRAASHPSKPRSLFRDLLEGFGE